MRGVRTVLQLGDFGYWTPGPQTREFLATVEKACAEHDVTLLWIDGNHEDFDQLYELPIEPETGLRPISDSGRVFHLPRGLRWSWHGRTWMALGGAASVDKQQRTAGESWWPEELLTDAEVEAAIAPGPVDVIVSHDAPDRVLIPGLAPPGFFPAEHIATSEWHRGRVGKVVDATKATTLFHGHYHRRHVTTRHSGELSTRVVGLADDGSSLRDNITVVDLAADPLTAGAR